MPMVHGPSGSTSPLARAGGNSHHHEQLSAQYNPYAYESREASQASSRSYLPSPSAHQQSRVPRLVADGQIWPIDSQASSSSSPAPRAAAAPSSSTVVALEHSNSSSPHHLNDDGSARRTGAPTTSKATTIMSPGTTASTSSLIPPPAAQMPTTAASLMREGPRDFTVIKDVGDGSFGTVCLADWRSPLPSGTLLSPMQHPTTRPEYLGKRLVAIKKMKKPFPNWEECMKLKELKVSSLFFGKKAPYHTRMLTKCFVAVPAGDTSSPKYHSSLRCLSHARVQGVAFCL